MLTVNDTIRASDGNWPRLAGILGREQAFDHGEIVARPRLPV